MYMHYNKHNSLTTQKNFKTTAV